jgi:hypothetical protein
MKLLQGKMGWLLGAAVCLGTGCVQTKMTAPARSAVEQLLLSTATDRALQEIGIPEISGRRVFVTGEYLESYDRAYALGAIRDFLSRNGALLAQSRDEAELIVEPRSGALSVDTSESLLGIPSMPVPVPFAGTFETPELAIFKTENQFSTARIALLAYERESGQHLHSTGALVGKARHRYFIILGYFRVTSSDIPEKHRGRP